MNIDLGVFSNLFKFTKKKKRISLGVDISNDSVKIVELERRDKGLHLKNYIIAKVKDGNLINFKDNKGHQDNIDVGTGQIVKNILNENNIKENQINLSVPSSTALITVFEVPSFGSKGQMEDLIKAEAEKYIPLPLKDVIYDCQVVEGDSSKEVSSENDKFFKKREDLEEQEALKKGMIQKVVLVAILKEISYQYEKTMNSAELFIESLEISSFSLIRSLVGEEKQNYLILDIGAKTCDVNLIMKGSLVLHKNIDFAGDKITKSLAKVLNISDERAEQIKIEKGLNLGTTEAERIVYEPFLGTLVEEIKIAVKFFEENYKGEKIESVILSGGSAYLIGLKEYLRASTGLEVFLGNPWSNVEYSKNLEKHLLRLGPSFSVAVGLALLGFEEN